MEIKDLIGWIIVGTIVACMVALLIIAIVLVASDGQKGSGVALLIITTILGLVIFLKDRSSLKNKIA